MLSLSHSKTHTRKHAHTHSQKVRGLEVADVPLVIEDEAVRMGPLPKTHSHTHSHTHTHTHTHTKKCRHVNAHTFTHIQSLCKRQKKNTHTDCVDREGESKREGLRVERERGGECEEERGERERDSCSESCRAPGD